MPRLLQVNTTLNYGSTGRIAEQIALSAQQEGWDCYIAHGGRYVGESVINSILVSSKLDNYIHAIKGEFLGMHGLGSTNATTRFVNIIKDLNPDIIHLHNIHGYYINYKLLFEYLATANIPVVWTLHDCWSFTGHCTHFENISCEKWKTECHECPLLMAQYKSRIIDRSKKNFILKKTLYDKLDNLTIVPVSEWLGGLVSHSILGRFPLCVIHNGINIDVFKPSDGAIRDRFSIPKEKTILLGVIGSGFNYEKGKQEFIELSKNNAYQVILIGLKDDETKGLPDNIIVQGRTNSQAELAQFYSSADIFLNPTYNDTFPTTNLEALACGTPVVTYRTGGSSEAVDKETGLVVDKGDLQSLNQAIQEIKKNGKLFYSQACRQRAIRCYNKDERFKDYTNLYNNLRNK